MALRASATARTPLPPPPSSASSWPRTFSLSKTPPKPQLKPNSGTLPTSTTLSLFALFTTPHEAQALSLSKEQIVSSLTQLILSIYPKISPCFLEFQFIAISLNCFFMLILQAEEKIDQVQEVISNFLDVAGNVIGVVVDTVKPGVDLALPVLKQAGGEAVKIATPAISEVSKKVQETIQGSGFDTPPVLSVAKVLICTNCQCCSLYL